MILGPGIYSPIKVKDLDTAGGTDSQGVVGLVYAASGGAVTVSAANPLPVDIGAASVTINASDIEIGAVEIKDGTTDDRVSVSAAGALKVDGSAVTQPVSLAALVGLKDSTGADLSLTAGGVYGLKVHVVGDSDKYVRGNIAHDAIDTASDPVNIGGTAASSLPTAVTAGDRVRGYWDVNGRLHVVVDTAPTTAVTGTFWQTTQPVSEADGANVTLGAKADAKSTATDTTAVTAMQVLKEISYMEQNPASRAVTNAGTFAVQTTPPTSGGLLIKNCTSGDGSTALTNTAQAIKASAGQLFGWYIFNPNTVTAWVIIYNVAAASVTVGTTNPALVIGVPAGSAANLIGESGIEFTNAGFSAAAVMTTAGGNTAPTTALDANFFYK